MRTYSNLPSISVVIATYNRAHLIGATLDSFLRQSLPPNEIIVVDDGSTDETEAEIARFGSRVRYLKQSNRGPGAARNAGLAVASGEFIQFFDSDDLASRNLLSAKAAALIENGNFVGDMAYGPWLPVWIDGETCRHDGVVRQSRAVEGDPVAAFCRGWLVLIQNCLVRRSLLEACGGYPTDLRTSEDKLLLLRMLQRSPRVRFTDEPLLLLRQHPEGQISASSKNRLERARESVEFAVIALQELERRGAERENIRRWRAHVALARAAASRSGLAPQSIAVFEPGLLDIARARISSFARRAELALSAHARGHRVHRTFAPGPVTPSTEALIRELGYEPIRK
ncbi:MAG: glycosyltransferase [Hyphomicrobium sp.]|nr:glycosyltransferase [Hyphomicrobium sp.]